MRSDKVSRGIRLSTHVEPGKPRDTFLQKQMSQIEAGLNQALAPQPVRTVNQKTAVTADDQWIIVDASIAAVTVQLPLSAQGVRAIEVKKVDTSVNAVKIIATGGELIDGAASVTLLAQYDQVTLVPGAGAWWRF